MTFGPVEFEGRVIGHAAERAGATFFFGLGSTDSRLLSRRFPDLDFARVEQVHGRDVVEADCRNASRADGHATSRQGVAPVIVTADCVPILLASRARVAAVHAGWRGVEADIVSAAAAGFDDRVLFAAIGPHLACPSFEVGRDVAARLSRVAPPGCERLEHPHVDGSKVYFDLTALVRAQLRRSFGRDLEILDFTPDTLRSPEYHSYRREGAGRGRNLSFVVRNA